VATLLVSIVTNNLSVRQAEELARRLNAAAEAAEDGETVSVTERRVERQLAPDAAAIEDRFRQALGTKVQLYKSRKGGRLVIHFYSDEELTGLYETICGPEGT
jgi:ParB family chromosome partitioning protein